ncbi:MAG: PP2C family protein-serine/threonine phosphatase [Bacteroidota bacterium]
MSSRRINHELQPLFEFSKVVNSSLDLEFILATVLRTLMGKMLAGKGMVLSRADKQHFRVQFVRGLPESLVGSLYTMARAPRAFVHLGRRKESWAATLGALEMDVLVPIPSRGSIVGYLALGRRMNAARYGTADKELLNSLVDLSGSAIEKALIIGQVNDANRNLDRKVQELNTLFDLSKELNAGLDLERVLRLLSFALMGQIGVRQYAVCLQQQDRMEIATSRTGDLAALQHALPTLCLLTKASSVEELLKHRECRSTAGDLVRLGFQAVIPMHIQSKTKGLILLGARLRGGEYSQADLEYLYALANLAIISIENARLFRETIEKQRLEDELIIAQEIQRGLLPESLPRVPTFDIAAANIPSKQVGGDYYDVLQRTDRELVIAIGDVSGKGTPAALLMANVQAALRALAPSEQSLSVITGRINDLTAANTRGGSKFITFFWGVLDTVSKTLTYVNAGHNPPVLVRASGAVEYLDRGGLFLGVLPTSVPYEQATVQLATGDLLVLFTDGVSEAMNASSEDFTEERLLDVIRRSRAKSCQEIIDTVLRAVEEHAAGTPQSDDITLLVLRAI